MKPFRPIAIMAGTALLFSLMIGCGRQDSESLDSSLLGPCEPAAKLTISAQAVGGTPERSPLRPVPGGDVDVILDEDVHFSYAVEACERTLLTRGTGEVSESAVVADGDAISLRHVLDTFCTASERGALELRPIIDGFDITVNEVFIGQPVRCTCPTPVSGRLEGLEPGAYTVRVVYAVERDGLVEEPEVLFETSVVVGEEAHPLRPDGGEEPFPVLAADVNLTKADDGGAAELPGIGGQLVVALEGNPSTGYNWLVEAVDESILRLVGDPDFLPDDPLLVGSGGKVALRFEGVGAGQTALRLVYRRPWENDVEPLETFEVQIDVR